MKWAEKQIYTHIVSDFWQGSIIWEKMIFSLGITGTLNIHMERNKTGLLLYCAWYTQIKSDSVKTMKILEVNMGKYPQDSEHKLTILKLKLWKDKYT